MKATKTKIATLLATCMLASIAAVPVSAAGFNGVDTTGGTTVNIPKGIVICNDGYGQSYIPNITYSFTIAPTDVAADTTVTDADGNSITILQGPIGGLTSEATLSFTSQNVIETDAADEGSLKQEVVGNIVLTVDVSKFSAPGVYRYTITDVTEADTLFRAGIVRGENYDTTRQIDVYIVRNTQTNALEVQGYVLTDDVTSITPSVGKDPGYVTPGEEITNYPGDVIEGQEVLGGEDMTLTPENGVDIYTTYNVEVTKLITGEMADVNHAFPFEIDVWNDDSVSADPLTVVDNVFVGNDAETLTMSTDDRFNTSLSNEDSFYIYGVSPFARFDVTETNDTLTAYNVSTSNDPDTVITVDPEDGLSTVDFAASTYADVNSSTDVSATAAAGANNHLTVTNDLGIIPPTGFLARVAPFAAILALAGGALCALKIRKHGKAEN